MLSMNHLLILAVHLLATIAKLLRPGGVRAVVAEIHVAKAPTDHQQPRTAAGASMSTKTSSAACSRTIDLKQEPMAHLG
jgi:hypothetical protein